MNYYEHHIRDYDAATAHLSWDQDMAYSRLLRWYYRKEKPLPADIAEVCRQIRATTKPQRAAVESVLREFFELREDGWHQDVCDEAIGKFKSREPERAAMQQNEMTRLTRHRTERAALFGEINKAGLHLPYNAPISEVRALVDRIRSTPETPATLPATGTATPATDLQRLPSPQSPNTRHQTPVFQEGEGAREPTPTRIPDGNGSSPPLAYSTRLTELGQQTAADCSDAWTDTGCDPQAMRAWLAHKSASGKPLPPHASISAGKLLLGMGSPETQRAAVQLAIANNWQFLRPQDGEKASSQKRAGGASASSLTIDEMKLKYPCPELDDVGS